VFAKIGQCTTLKKGANQHHSSNPFFPFIKLLSFSGESDPNVYLGWEAKVEQTFYKYEVQEDQKFRLDIKL